MPNFSNFRPQQRKYRATMSLHRLMHSLHLTTNLSDRLTNLLFNLIQLFLQFATLGSLRAPAVLSSLHGPSLVCSPLSFLSPSGQVNVTVTMHPRERTMNTSSSNVNTSSSKMVNTTVQLSASGGIIAAAKV